MTHLTHFLPCPENGNGPKMTQNDPQLKVVPKWLKYHRDQLFDPKYGCWSHFGSGSFWNLKLSTVQWAHDYLNNKTTKNQQSHKNEKKIQETALFDLMKK